MNEQNCTEPLTMPAISFASVVLPVPAKPNRRNIWGPLESCSHRCTAWSAAACCPSNFMGLRTGLSPRRPVGWLGGRFVVGSGRVQAVLLPLLQLIERVHDLALEPEELRALARSEEHTSALHSLMRNLYAVFCLKK